MGETALQPGQQIVITQQIPQGDKVWTTRMEGTVVRVDQKMTGSWYAGSRNDRLWLDRLLVRKDDGEQVLFNLDQYTHVRLLAAAAPNTSATGAESAESAPQTADTSPSGNAHET